MASVPSQPVDDNASRAKGSYPLAHMHLHVSLAALLVARTVSHRVYTHLRSWPITGANCSAFLLLSDSCHRISLSRVVWQHWRRRSMVRKKSSSSIHAAIHLFFPEIQVFHDI